MVLLIKYCMGEQVEEEKKTGVCSMHGGEQKCVQGFG
jgi:hypothetical protein